MSAPQARRRTRQFGVSSKSNLLTAYHLECVCEAVEKRLLLSATFATPTSITVNGARAPLVASRFKGSGNPVDIAVATATTVQILTGSSNGVFTLGSSIPLPANPTAESPFEIGDFMGSGTTDIVLDSHNSGTGDGAITYETNSGSATFSAGPVTNITDGGAGFTPIVGRSGDFDGDGTDDLAIVGKPGSGGELVLAVMLSNGDGTFNESDIPIVGSNAAGDTSNEQVIASITNEIVVYDGSSGDLDVFSGAGDGNFTQLTPTPLTASLIGVGTFNDNQDIVVADGDQVSVLVNQNDGTYQPDPQGPITLGGPIDALDIGDMDLDGNEDILTNQGILFGNGDETFNPTPQALPISVNGGGNVSNTLQAVFLGNSRQGVVGFAASGNAIVSAVNTSPVGVSIDLESTNNPANPGADVQFTATISSEDSNFTGTPTGNVTFLNGSNVLGTAALSDGTATFDAGSSLSGSANSITAQYSGNATFGATTSAPLTQTVLSTSVTTLTSNENPSVAGDDVIFTAVVSGNDGAGDVPDGNVEFFDNGTDLGGGAPDSTGTATFDTTGTLAVGSHSITAQFQGDVSYSGSLSNVLTQVVNQPELVPVVASTTLPSAIVAGTKVHGTISVVLTNHTASAISADQITVFASSNGSIVNATPLVTDISKRGIPIKAELSKVVKLTVKSLPKGLSDGTYQLLVQVNSSLGLNSNSSTGPSINVAAPFVNLAGVAGTGIVKPNLVKAGKFVSMTIALTNSGNITSVPASVGIGLSTDGQNESSMLETTKANIKIKPGHAGVLHLHFKIPETVLAGTYEPFISITDDGDVTMIIGQTFTVET